METASNHSRYFAFFPSVHSRPCITQKKGAQFPARTKGGNVSASKELRRIPLTLDTKRLTATTSPLPATSSLLHVAKLHVVNQTLCSLPLPIMYK